MQIEQARRLKESEKGNDKLKKLIAGLSRDNAVIIYNYKF
jgi:hypothetical protein